MFTFYITSTFLSNPLDVVLSLAALSPKPFPPQQRVTQPSFLSLSGLAPREQNQLSAPNSLFFFFVRRSTYPVLLPLSMLLLKPNGSVRMGHRANLIANESESVPGVLYKGVMLCVWTFGARFLKRTACTFLYLFFIIHFRDGRGRTASALTSTKPSVCLCAKENTSRDWMQGAICAIATGMHPSQSEVFF